MKSVAVLVALVAAVAGLQPPPVVKTGDGRNSSAVQKEIEHKAVVAKEAAGETTLIVNMTSVPPLAVGYKTYYLFNTSVNWHHAFLICSRHNLSLASINSPVEQDILENHIVNAGLRSAYWTSATDQAEKGEFVWMTTGQAISYKNWGEARPDNKDGAEHCVHLRSSDFKWNDYPCSEKQFFICEKYRGNC